MKIALAQMRMTDNMQENLNETLRYIDRSGNDGADLVIFPELQLSPFFPSEPGADASRYLLTSCSDEILKICDACKRTGTAAGINLYLNENDSNYDASLMISSCGEVLGISKMVHIASFPHFYESEYYTPSDTGFEVCEMSLGGRLCKVGTVICFDRHFPESIRSCALQGAELIIIPTANLTEEPEDMFLWEVRVQAMQSRVCIAMCNRVGTEGDITFCGRSLIVDHRGDIISYADGSEQLLVGTVDLEAAEEARRMSPYITCRRPEMYNAISNRGEKQ